VTGYSGGGRKLKRGTWSGEREAKEQLRSWKGKGRAWQATAQGRAKKKENDNLAHARDRKGRCSECIAGAGRHREEAVSSTERERSISLRQEISEMDGQRSRKTHKEGEGPERASRVKKETSDGTRRNADRQKKGVLELPSRGGTSERKSARHLLNNERGLRHFK